MDHTQVADAVDRTVPTISSDASIGELVSAAQQSRHGVLAVTDPDGTLVGLISHHVLREAIVSRGNLDPVVLAADLAEAVDPLSPRDTLRRALAVMNARGIDAVPVVESTADGARFAGLLSRADVLLVYERALSQAV